MNDLPFSPLPDRTRVGRNLIQRFLWSTPLGAVYEVTIGSTTHEYGLLVLASEPAACGLNALQSILKPIFAASNPCLAKPYACGEDGGRLWIRMELTEAVRVSRFARNRGREDEDDFGEDVDRIEDAQELLSTARGPLPERILTPVVGDLIEGLVAVHKAGGLLGPLTLRDIGFEEWPRHTGFPVIAKWCNYGLLALRDPAAAETWTPHDDFRMLAGLIRTLLCGEGSTTPPADAWREWQNFLARCDAPDGFADAEALSEAYDAVLAAHSTHRLPRIRPEDTIAPPESPTSSPSLRYRNPSSGSKPHRHSRRNYQPSNNRSQRVLLAIAAVAVIGIVVLQLKPNLVRDIRNRIQGAGTAPKATPVLTDTLKGTNAVDTAAIAADADLWSLPFETLNTAAKAEPANLPVRMRYAFALAEGDAKRAPEPEAAAALAAETYIAMGAHDIGIDLALDRACDFWMGYALLAGLGVEADASRGLLLLSKAEEVHGDAHAKSLLADYYASGAEDGHTAQNDAAALSRWFEIVEKESGASRLSSDAAACADKIIAFYFANRAIPDHEQDRYIARIESIAKRRHLPAILALGRIYLDGKIVQLDEGSAKKWYSDAAQYGNAEGMYHMAWMLERGIAAAPSDRAAAIWYRRAALAGNAEAMRALARLLREQRVKTESGEILDSEGGKTADQWEASAATEAVLPPALPYTTWWLGKQADRFPSPDPVRPL